MEGLLVGKVEVDVRAAALGVLEESCVAFDCSIAKTETV